MPSTNEILSGATRGAKYNVILQILFRLITFGVNAVILRYVSKATLGIANVRLLLLYSTSLLFSREAIRKTALDLKPRYEHGERAVDVAQCRNLSWVSVPTGFIITTTLAWVWTHVLYTPTVVDDSNADAGDMTCVVDRNNANNYGFCVVLFSLSVIFELLCDSLYIRCQNEMKQRVCVLIEGVSILIRAGVTVALALSRPDLGILAFGFGQLSFSFFMCAQYYFYFTMYRSIPLKHLLPGRVKAQVLNNSETNVLSSSKNFPPKSIKLARTLFTQSLLKQFLTEGEKFLMTMVANINFEAQGVYVHIYPYH